MATTLAPIVAVVHSVHAQIAPGTVHDEIVSEPTLERGPDLAEFEEIISRTDRWAEEYPLSAEAWIGHRFRKE